MDLYFLGEDNQNFKATVPYNPYFYLGTKEGTERDVISYLTRKYQGKISKQDLVEKEDLDMVNCIFKIKFQII